MDQQTKNLLIVLYEPAYREAFATLNEAWIARYFSLEPHDIEQLHHPEKYILAEGGQIWCAITESGVVAGTVALVASGAGQYEMAKMSVADAFQGRGLGRRLGEAAIEWAREQGATRLWLESNRRLAPALHLYETLGFREVPLVPSPYARADIRMELSLP